MILVDTSIWVDHLRTSSKRLTYLLQEDLVLAHPFVIGELALSGLNNRDEILQLIGALPKATEATHDEVMEAVGQWSLDRRGIGWVDTHLLTAALLSDAQVWTADKRLRAVCSHAGIAFGTSAP